MILDMNTKTLTLAFVIVAIAAALALAPSLSYNGALAKKSCETGNSGKCNQHAIGTPSTTCTNPTGKEDNCNGNVG